MPVWKEGGVGELDTNVLLQSNVYLDYGETGWMYINNYNLLDNTFLAGVNEKGDKLYVGRAIVDGDLIPGMIIIDKQLGLFCNNNKVVTTDDMHILCGSQLRWSKPIKRFASRFHPAAVIAGRTKEGIPLYVGKTICNGEILIGMIDPRTLVLYVPSGKNVSMASSYEILTNGYH